MGCTSSRLSINVSDCSVPSWYIEQPGPVRGAGCLFLTDSHALAGFHATRRPTSTVRVSGLGGKTMSLSVGEEPWWQTAFRETVEELFAPQGAISFSLYHALVRIMPTPHVRYDIDSAYVVLVFRLEDLNNFIKTCSSYIISPLYQSFPSTWQELILQRVGHVENIDNLEVTDLVLWPRKNIHREFRVTRDFLRDLEPTEFVNSI
jgi:hypothetical protein